MPLMGEGITEATLVKWLKKPGDKLQKDEPLLEVSTDKVDTEIPAPASGYLLKTTASAGDTVAINSVIAFISEDPNAKITESPTPVRKAAPTKAAASASPSIPTSYAPPPQMQMP